MIEKLIQNCSLNLIERPCGIFSSFKAQNMEFTEHQYLLKDFGNLSLLSSKSKMGSMKMDSFVITAYEKDLPLVSIDVVEAMGNVTLILEAYDTLVTEKTSSFKSLFSKADFLLENLATKDPGNHWYDNIRITHLFKNGSNCEEVVLEAASLVFNEIINLGKKGKTLTPEERILKVEKVQNYVNGLLSNGGPATDSFVNLFGLDDTRAFFECHHFGTR